MALTTAYVQIVGRLTADPQPHSTKDGKAFAKASVAVNGPKDNASFYEVLAFGHNADWLLKATKGDLIALRGSQEIERWSGKDGGSRTSVTVRVDHVNLLTAKPVEVSANGEAPAEDPFK